VIGGKERNPAAGKPFHGLLVGARAFLSSNASCRTVRAEVDETTRIRAVHPKSVARAL
jgi:hypothetical protein